METQVKDRQLSHYLIVSHAFTQILDYLSFKQQVQLQIINKTFYNIVIPRYLQHRVMMVRPTFVYFNFQDVKWQKRQIMKNAHSSESKSSGDELGTFLYGEVCHYFHDARPNPWRRSKIRISPALATKGHRTVITNKRFRAFLIGGINSAQNYEYLLQRNNLKPRRFMH